MGFSRQEYWSGLPFPSPGKLPNPGIEPRSPALQADPLPSKPLGKLPFNSALRQEAQAPSDLVTPWTHVSSSLTLTHWLHSGSWLLRWDNLCFLKDFNMPTFFHSSSPILSIPFPFVRDLTFTPSSLLPKSIINSMYYSHIKLKALGTRIIFSYNA